MTLLQKVRQPPWRTIVPALLIVGCLAVAWISWRPGLVITDGRHDRGQNGIWIGHGWLGADEWFIRYGKTNQLASFRSSERIAALAARLRDHGITDVFPHLCPAVELGNLPPADDAQVERFLDGMSGIRTIVWIGGPNGSSVLAKSSRWRSTFCASIRDLFSRHPRLAGVQLNVEPCTSGDTDFLVLLEDVRRALPRGTVLSVAAYPPPTHWHPFPDVHWDEAYFREVAKRSDQLAVMMYDTSIRHPKFYTKLMADWTEEILKWSEGKAVLLGVPTYSDSNVGYHNPKVETIRHALPGIHAGLARLTVPTNYQGIAVYSEWETDADEWSFLRQSFGSGPR